jgi:H+-translocating NAD(P) transhydrogenase subunit alpha
MPLGLGVTCAPVRVGVPLENRDGERRVALVPEAARKLQGRGVEVVVERGAGERASHPDAAYEADGSVVADSEAVWGAEVVAKVAAPTPREVELLRQGAVIIGFLAPLTDPEGVQRLASAGVTAFAMESIPRITRAQAMDALSSQSNVAGYKATLIAANQIGRFFPMLMTAAGTVKPAKVLVLGAGVAGLQAIATAKRLGAQVTSFDVRAAVKEQVESLGARFLELDLGEDLETEGGYARALDEEGQRRQQAALAEAAGGFDAVITTALVPGRPAPLLITAAGVENMRPGSVIVDMAGESGGNCELSVPGETIVHERVTIAAPLNLPSEMAEHSSQLYARNVSALLELLVVEGELNLNWDDPIVSGACVAHAGQTGPPAAAPASAETAA